jgi:PIN domain nuclease of toxin-antitoxin system
MQALIDTHSYIWYISGNDRLSKSALDIIDNEQNDIFISIASIWELSIKVKLGKLKLISDFHSIEEDLRRFKISVLQITIQDILHNYELPYHHRDPFDRMIISQALRMTLPIIGCDESFDAYSVNRIW